MCVKVWGNYFAFARDSQQRIHRPDNIYDHITSLIFADRRERLTYAKLTGKVGESETT